MVISLPTVSRGRRRSPWVFGVANVLMPSWRGDEGRGWCVIAAAAAAVGGRGGAS